MEMKEFAFVQEHDCSSSISPRDDDHKNMLAHVDVWEGASKTTPRIFCGIFTHRKNHFTKVKVGARSLKANPRPMTNTRRRILHLVVTMVALGLAKQRLPVSHHHSLGAVAPLAAFGPKRPD